MLDSEIWQVHAEEELKLGHKMLDSPNFADGPILL